MRSIRPPPDWMGQVWFHPCAMDVASRSLGMLGLVIHVASKAARSQVMVVTAAIVLMACGAEAPEADRDVPLLLGDQVDASDTLRRTLVAKQRAVFNLLLSGERSRLVEYLDAGFNASRGLTTVIIPGQGPVEIRPSAPTGVQYLAVLGGANPVQLDALPTEYNVQLASRDFAVVIASNPASSTRIVTVWRQLAGGWRATQMGEVSTMPGAPVPSAIDTARNARSR